MATSFSLQCIYWFSFQSHLLVWLGSPLRNMILLGVCFCSSSLSPPLSKIDLVLAIICVSPLPLLAASWFSIEFSSMKRCRVFVTYSCTDIQLNQVYATLNGTNYIAIGIFLHAKRTWIRVKNVPCHDWIIDLMRKRCQLINAEVDVEFEIISFAANNKPEHLL